MNKKTTLLATLLWSFSLFSMQEEAISRFLQANAEARKHELELVPLALAMKLAAQEAAQRAEEGKRAECYVCFETLNNNNIDTAICLTCKRALHVKCLKQWSAIQRCPACEGVRFIEIDQKDASALMNFIDWAPQHFPSTPYGSITTYLNIVDQDVQWIFRKKDVRYWDSKDFKD